MNKFFQEYVDLTALIIAFLTPLMLTFIIKRSTGKQTRAVAVYFLLFGPAAILEFMFFHLFENSYHAVENVMAGTFKYSFHFYSLILIGVVLATIAGFLVSACWQKCVQQQFSNRPIFLYMFLVAIVCLPLFPITPLGKVPVFCCFISLLAMFLVRRKIKRTHVTVIHEDVMRLSA